MTHPLYGIVLAGGRGSRFGSSVPKVFHEIAGQPLAGYAVEAIKALNPQRIAVVVPNHYYSFVQAHWPFAMPITQLNPLGTGHAAKVAIEGLGLSSHPGPGISLIALGDMPLLEPYHFASLVASVQEGAHLALLVCRMENPYGYGRVMLDAQGNPTRIVEEREALEHEKNHTLCWAGAMAFSSEAIEGLSHLPQQQGGVYYLTDLLAWCHQQGLVCHGVEVPFASGTGVNTRSGLSSVYAALQARWRQRFMDAGVTLYDPNSVFFSHDTIIAEDVTIEPFITFGKGVVLDKGTRIRSFSYLEQAHIHANASIGPFAHIRGGTIVGDGSTVGNFVELKASILGKGVKAKHLSYLGDAEIGESTNIGAGTITCNYDGFSKHKSIIGNHVSIGAHTALIAPLTVGDGAIIGAGSVITESVQPDALTLTRAPQITHARGGVAYRASKKKRGTKKGTS